MLITQVKESGPTAWRARIAGRKAAEVCTKKGFKALYGETDEILRTTVDAWLGADCEGDGGGNEPESGEDCGSAKGEQWRINLTVECVRPCVDQHVHKLS